MYNKDNYIKYKANGFTLIETVFVVLLTSLIISLAYTYFNNFQRYLKKSRVGTEKETILLRFSSLLTYDFDKSRYIVHGIGNELVFVHPEGETIYSLNDSHIVRHQAESSDTLFMGHTDYSIGYLSEQKKLINRLEISFKDAGSADRQIANLKLYPVKVIFDGSFNNHYLDLTRN